LARLFSLPLITLLPPYVIAFAEVIVAAAPLFLLLYFLITDDFMITAFSHFD